MRRISILRAGALAFALAGCFGPGSPRIDLVRGQRDRFEVRGLDREFLSSPAAAETDWGSSFLVTVDAGPSAAAGAVPSLAGSSKLEGDRLVFEPRYPLEPGLRYRACLRPGPWRGQGGDSAEPIFESFALAPKVLEQKTVVERVYPTAGTIPENQLKLYVYFSGPMRRGQAYQRVHLLDAAGHEVEAPFLELGEELWDPDFTRFTLFFDPARVKRGLKPHDDVGPPLVAGKTYTLLIDKSWLDAEGAPLRAEYRQQLQVGLPDYETPDPKAWKVSPPPAGSTAPLVVAFPEPLDHALALRLLRVRDADGEILPGEPSTMRDDREWRFQPAKPWRSGAHTLLVDTILEDLAGNSVSRPFEVDASRGIESRIELEIVEVPFEIARQ